MPTYKNETDRKITFSDKTYMEWNPGETRDLTYFVPHKDLGLTLISPLPKVSQNSCYLYTEIALSTGGIEKVELPYHQEFDLSVSALMGACKMFIGDSEDPIIIDQLHDHVAHYAWDMTAYLTFEGLTSGGVIMVKMDANASRERKLR